MRRQRAWPVAILVLACTTFVACDPSSGDDKNDGRTRPTLDLSDADDARFDAHGSVEQVWVTGAAPKKALGLVAPDGTVVERSKADAQGSKIFRDVKPGAGYRVIAGGGDNLVASGGVDVTAADEPPDHDVYAKQKINDGYGYLETRDGTLLSINVKLPGPVEEGPYPTVVEYSGYSPADPDSPQPSTLISGALGYATVGVNMRGTGCSGGAFEFFETLQSTDGYDVIETIAAQPWVKFNTVGMVGLSYPGISQLFVAQLQPPSLSAIAPLSVIADTGRGTLRPGGIFNNGFALSWAQDRKHDAEAAPKSGQSWAGKRIEEGDKICEANQVLRAQAPDILEMIDANEYWTDEVAAPLAPELFVHNINVPVFLVGAWQDEQVGGYFANLFDDFTGTDNAYFTATNGGHTEPLAPVIFQRWYEFLAIYVAQQVPETPGAAPVILDTVGGSVFGTTDLELPPNRFEDIDDYEDAKQLFENDARVRILLDNGAGGAPGVPEPASEFASDDWPVEGTTATAWFFDENGTLVADAPDAEGADDYRYDPSHSQVTTFTGSDNDVWKTLPAFNWPAPAAGTALAYETAPLDATRVMAGTGSIDLWLQSTARDTDVQVTFTEVRPDGNETFVQSGWLRASNRALSGESTELRPAHPFTKDAVEDLPKGQFADVRVELFPFAHVFREGSKIRIIIDAPGASRPRWKFDALAADGNVTNSIARGGAHASRIVLPVVEGVDDPGTPLPPCPSLRGQPCRPVAAILNAS